MKTKRHHLLLLIVLLFSFVQANAQVTIGNETAPEQGALLELKEKDVVNPDKDNVLGLENSTKGILYPKVSLKASDLLTPLYGGAEGNDGVWSDLSTDKEKLMATGMVVYNVNKEAMDLDEGLYMWRINEWIKLSGGIGQAQFDPVSCNNIIVNGTYVEGKAITSENYLSVTLNVTKIGTYAVSATSGNGYSFYFSGVALDLGPLTLKVPSQGKPILVQTDELKIEGIELVAGCEPTVEVMTAVAAYSINCATVVVNGQFLKGQALTGQTLTLSVNVTDPGSYVISTPVINGISFRAEGEFTTATTSVITMAGTGTPTVNLDFPIEIRANTIEGNNTCSAIIPITLPRMTYAILGNDVWSWATPARETALNNGGVSFGPNGKVRIASFNQLWKTTAVNDAAAWLNNGFGANNDKPDIVLFFAYGTTANDNIKNALITYINKGGCVIFASRDDSAGDVNTILRGVFNLSSNYAVNQTVNGATDDDVYKINNLPDDPIINGPFGNLAGAHWAEDNATSGSIILTQLPPNSVQICSALSASKADNGADPERASYSIVWYNENKNFVYFGDSTGASSSNNNRNEYPTRYNTAGEPIAKLYRPYPGTYYGYQQTIYNSALELNSVAWALKKAAVAGINRR